VKTTQEKGTDDVSRVMEGSQMTDASKKLHTEADIISQVERHLGSNYALKKNIVLGRTFVKARNQDDWKLLDERTFNTLLAEMIKKGIKVNASLLRVVMDSGFVPEFDPFVDYYNSLSMWDGKDYIGQLAATVKTNDDVLFRSCLEKWIVASVANQINLDAINQTVLVLQGGQGIGKTRWCLSLIPKALKGYCYEGKINAENKDTLLHLSECGWIIMDELASLRKNSIEAFKELVTQPIIRLRRSYGFFPENMVRRASFIGTTNSNQFLVDTTGNRRFLPFCASMIDHNHTIDMNLVYAQALALYKSGFQFWFSDEEIQQMAVHNKEFEQVSLEEDLIMEEFLPCDIADADVYLNATGVVKYLGHYHKISLNNTIVQRVGSAMSKLGFQKVKRNGSVSSPYFSAGVD
jgi:predicted P-loop ATPase